MKELMDRWEMENIDLEKSVFLMEQISDQIGIDIGPVLPVA